MLITVAEHSDNDGIWTT